ncbi:hypothetical protein JOY44_01850 [Phormidium sp. CLA17]|uniref:hypothetical protein n=1 Tax=Leptolyngbya sp. Cla-17 TaxID=2803751 RepID=UPI001933403C|nr:hypothetical protein [Leptolyngbya sp. Cla-17]MBM0740370.1 hypothetical protein [Leptolyngbya sp. Cla-17]
MYYLHFALNIQWSSETSIVHTPESFAEAPISISKPEIIEMLNCFSKGFQQVAVMETKAEVVKSDVKSASVSETNSSITVATPLKVESKLSLVSDTAFICEQKALNQESLVALCDNLARYIQDSTKSFNGDNLLDADNHALFSGLRESIDLRSYLSRYITSTKKMYCNGYLYFLVA